MNETRDNVGENDLHAYVDGQLDDGRRAEVEAWLATRAQEAERVASWTMQNERIRDAFSADFVSRHSDLKILEPKHVSLWSRFALPSAATAAALLVFVAGFASGRLTLAPPLAPVPSATAARLASEARSAFLIYTSEVRHPVEVGADQQEHLATWLGKRLNYRLRLPDISSLGYKLVGGRLVPVEGKAGALLMYQNEGGQRLTMLIGRNEDNRETSFRIDADGAVRTFYWIDGPIGYAVTGEISQDELRRIADECYRQLDDA